MSTDSFKAFAAKVQDDPGLRDEIRAASGEKGIAVDALARLAAGHGYEFTVDEVSDELGEAQLEGVAGGLSRTTIPKTLLSSLEGKIEISSFTNLDGTLYIKWDG